MKLPQRASVAPRAGAWIETYNVREILLFHLVAPRAGAWIETLEAWKDAGQDGSRAPCGRVD